MMMISDDVRSLVFKDLFPLLAYELNKLEFLLGKVLDSLLIKTLNLSLEIGRAINLKIRKLD